MEEVIIKRMKGVQVEVFHRMDKVVVMVSGSFDEYCNFDDVDLDIQMKVDVNLKNVTFINSPGVRNWINFIHDVSLSREVTFVECPTIVMEQFFMIYDFGGKGEIKTFYVPYYCSKCDESSEILVLSEDYLKEKIDLEDMGVKCSKCNEPMEIEEEIDKYEMLFEEVNI